VQTIFQRVDAVKFVEIEEFRLERPEEALHGGIVQAVASSILRVAP
jgi:hypothetical protein